MAAKGNVGFKTASLLAEILRGDKLVFSSLEGEIFWKCLVRARKTSSNPSLLFCGSASWQEKGSSISLSDRSRSPHDPTRRDATDSEIAALDHGDDDSGGDGISLNSEARHHSSWSSSPGIPRDENRTPPPTPQPPSRDPVVRGLQGGVDRRARREGTDGGARAIRRRGKTIFPGNVDASRPRAICLSHPSVVDRRTSPARLDGADVPASPPLLSLFLSLRSSARASGVFAARPSPLVTASPSPFSRATPSPGGAPTALRGAATSSTAARASSRTSGARARATTP